MADESTRGTRSPKRPDRYAYRDYRNWPDEERWELIDGKAWDMSSSPPQLHQTVLGQLCSQLDAFLTGKPCRVYVAPVDVFLIDADEEINDAKYVVQPDAFVVCDKRRLIDEGVKGAPDFIIEIMSRGTELPGR